MKMQVKMAFSYCISVPAKTAFEFGPVPLN